MTSSAATLLHVSRPEVPSEPRTGIRRHLGLAIHLVSLVVGGTYLVIQDRRLWFFADEWDFIVDRGLHHPVESIWAPHNEHWVTLPILLWRLLYTMFGIHHYWPYIATLVVAHLLVCHFLYRLARDGVTSSLVAALGVAPFVVFGPGAENLTTAFQITFVGPLAFGLAALLLIRRPTIGAGRMAAIAALTLAALMCSAVGDAVLAAVAIALLMRFGPRVMAATVSLPVASYVFWYERFGHSGVVADHITPTDVLGVPAFVLTSISDSLGQAVGLNAAGAPLLIALAAFVCLTWASLRCEPERIGLLAALLVFLVLTALARARGGDAPASRYVYIVVCLLLPVVLSAVGWAALRRAAAPLVVIGLVVLVGDISALQTYVQDYRPIVDAERAQIMAEAALVDHGATLVGFSPYAPNLQMVGLRTLLEHGQLQPPPLGQTASLAASAAYEVVVTPAPPNPTLGGLTYEGSNHIRTRTERNGCVVFHPTSKSPQLILRSEDASGLAELDVPSNSAFVAFVGTPPGPGVTKTALSGSDLLSESLGHQQLVLSLPGSAPTTVCGLADPPRHTD